MTSKERVYAVLDHKKPDRVPVEIGALPAVHERYGDRLQSLIDRRDVDIVCAPWNDPTEDKLMYEVGVHTDLWGSRWESVCRGMAGEVKGYPLEDDDAIAGYQSPTHLFLEAHPSSFFNDTIAFARQNKDKFIRAGWIRFFEQMQFLRGTENLFCDIAWESDEFFAIRDIVLEYELTCAKIVSSAPGVDAIVVGDDWGSQRSLLISLESWRKLFKPGYQQIIDTIHKNGKKVFFHSDGYILDLYEDLIDMGIDAINSQIWCMGPEKVAEKIQGRIALWGELNRQSTLPFGTKEDILREIAVMKEVFGDRLIGQFEAGADVPLENIETALFGW